jgi:hypothetical protein
MNDLNIFMTEVEKSTTELLDKWYVKGINRRIFTVKFSEKISAIEAATRVLEKEIKSTEKITLNKKIQVYGTYNKAPIHSFVPEVVACNAGYYTSLKKSIE